MKNSREVSPYLQIVSAIETLVLAAAGLGLFFLPTTTRQEWMWDLTPFNTRFLGAIYISSMIGVLSMVIWRHWSMARLVQRAVFTFTVIVLLVSIAYNDRFKFDQWSAYGWWALYIFFPLYSGYHLWQMRDLPGLPKPAGLLRTILYAGGAGVALYALALMVLPDKASTLFPWKIDAYHSRMYSAVFMAGAAMLFTLTRGAKRADYIAAAAAEIGFGVFALLGMYVVDADVNRIDWSSTATFAWIGLFAAMIGIGVTMIVLSGREK